MYVVFDNEKVFLLLLLTICALWSKISFCSAFALSSPSFPRQEITDPVDDWSIVKSHQKFTYLASSLGTRDLVQLGNSTQDCKIRQQENNLVPDIDAVTYLSDGKVLNVTLWLSHPFVNPSSNKNTSLSPPFQNIPLYLIRYGMSIDVHSVYENEGSDYGIRYLWDAVNNTWARMTHEISPFGDIKILNQQYKHDMSTYNGKRYIELYLDLGSLYSPDQYSIVFYVYDFFIQNGHLCRLVDITNRVFIPPPDFIISASPSSIILRPGEEKTIGLQLKANTNIKSEAFLSTDQTTHNYAGYHDGDVVKLDFTSNRISIPSYGIVTSSLNVKVSQNAKPGPYIIPIFANVSIPTELKSRASSITGEILYNSISEHIAKNSNITVTVLPPVTIQEKLSSLWDSWLAPISGFDTLIAAIVAGASPWIVNIIRKKKLRKKNKLI
jgi:hypothetical protein